MKDETTIGNSQAEDFGVDLDDFQRAVESAYALLNPTEGRQR